MQDERLRTLLTERKTQAEKERMFHLLQAHVAEGIALDAAFILGALDAPDHQEDVVKGGA